jgi:hypothetical protein
MKEKITERERLRRIPARQHGCLPYDEAFFLQLEERWHQLARSTDRNSHAMPDGFARNRKVATTNLGGRTATRLP